MEARHARAIDFFGAAGQEKIGNTRVSVVGVGGVGGHLVQQLALLGVRSIAVIDAEQLEATNLNRYPTARASDPIPGTWKVDIAERMINEIDPSVEVVKVRDSLVSEDAYRAIITSAYVFGGLDSEGARLILTELCAAYCLPYIDVASDIQTGGTSRYGGRVFIARRGEGCLLCFDLLDMREAQCEISGSEGRALRQAIYGIDKTMLRQSGPSVVSINGAVASLAVTEFMVDVAGIREPKALITYRGDMGTSTVSSDKPAPGCYYCKGIWGMGDDADLRRYIRGGVGKFLR
jgi:molybdopterin/thiamine biosynthesis adenylyltransferase